MLVIPAIDLKDGRCVRLRQGDMAAETVYSDDGPAVAKQWQQGGASLIHVVDLNGAVDGEPRNLSQISAIIQAGVDAANQAFANSRINILYRLVKTAEEIGRAHV